MKIKSSKIIKTILAEKWYAGRVVKGKARGRQMGLATINLKGAGIDFKQGVYSCLVKIKGKIYSAVLHYGQRPTFNEKNLVLEIHVLNFGKKIDCGTIIYFKLQKFLRKTQKFKNQKQLIKQINNDIIKAA